MQGFPICLFAADGTRTRSVFRSLRDKNNMGHSLVQKLSATTPPPAGSGADRNDHGLMKYCNDRVSNTLPAFGSSACD